MTKKKQKQLTALGWGMLILGSAVTLGFATHAQKNMVCNEIKPWVDPANNMHFITEDDIIQMLLRRGVQAQGKTIGEIDIAAVEQTILDIPSVEKAAVYTTVRGKLHIDVVQRTPVVRIFNENGSSFYLDVNGVPMPLSMNYTARTLPVTGKLVETQRFSVDEILANDSLREVSMLDDVFTLASYIEQDPFLRAQIVQVDVNENNEFELIPRVGGHRILFGRTNDPEPRFNKLKLFYEKGLKKSDRRKYDLLDLRFEEQVVCTRKKTY